MIAKTQKPNLLLKKHNWYPGVIPRDLLVIPPVQLKTKYKFIPKHKNTTIKTQKYKKSKHLTSKISNIGKSNKKINK